jgi:hypothetical protein
MVYYKCDICNYNTKHSSKINKHNKSQKHYISVSKLYNNIVDTDKIKYSCNLCNKMFSMIPIGWTGENISHDPPVEIKDYNCDKCDYSSYMLNALKTHIKMIHDQIKDFKCDDCDYACSTKQHLNRHIKSHLNDNLRGSVGERLVMAKLDELKVEYMHDKSFNGLLGINSYPLRFDFIIPTLNESYIFIEFDGMQHFRPVRFGGISIERATEQLKITQSNDYIKDGFCAKNNFQLLRIKYNEVDNLDNYILDFILQNDVL